MKKLTLAGIIMGSFLMAVLSGCGGGGGPTGPVLFDDFESYSLTDFWYPSNGWELIGGGLSCSIVADAESQVLNHKAATGAIINENFSGSDYTVTAKIKPSADNASVGLVGRYCTAGCYVLGLGTDKLRIYKVIHGEAYYPVDDGKDFDFNNSTYYTVSLKLSGNVLTGSVTDGINTTTVTFTDDGSFHGGAFTEGNAGLYVTGGVVNNKFDDFTVTVP